MRHSIFQQFKNPLLLIVASVVVFFAAGKMHEASLHLGRFPLNVSAPTTHSPVFRNVCNGVFDVEVRFTTPPPIQLECALGTRAICPIGKPISPISWTRTVKTETTAETETISKVKESWALGSIHVSPWRSYSVDLTPSKDLSALAAYEPYVVLQSRFKMESGCQGALFYAWLLAIPMFLVGIVLLLVNASVLLFLTKKP